MAAARGNEFRSKVRETARPYEAAGTKQVSRMTGYSQYSRPQFSDLKSMFDKKDDEADSGVDRNVAVSKIMPSKVASASKIDVKTLVSSGKVGTYKLNDISSKTVASRTFSAETKSIRGGGRTTGETKLAETADVGSNRLSLSLPYGSRLRQESAIKTSSLTRTTMGVSSDASWTTKEQEAINKAADTINRLVFRSERAKEILMEKRTSLEECLKPSTTENTQDTLAKRDSLSRRDSGSGRFRRDSRNSLTKRDSYSPVLGDTLTRKNSGGGLSRTEIGSGSGSSSGSEFTRRNSGRSVGLDANRDLSFVKADALSGRIRRSSTDYTDASSCRLDGTMLNKQDVGFSNSTKAESLVKTSSSSMGDVSKTGSRCDGKVPTSSIQPNVEPRFRSIKGRFEKSSDESDWSTRSSPCRDDEGLKVSPRLDTTKPRDILPKAAPRRDVPSKVTNNVELRKPSKYCDSNQDFDKTVVDVGSRITKTSHVPSVENDSRERTQEASVSKSLVANRIKRLEHISDGEQVAVTKVPKTTSPKRNSRVDKSNPKRRISKKSTSSSEGYDDVLPNSRSYQAYLLAEKARSQSGYDDALSNMRNYQALLLAEKAKLQPISYSKQRSASTFGAESNIVTESDIAVARTSRSLSSEDERYHDAMTNVENFKAYMRALSRTKSASLSDEENIYDDIREVLAACQDLSDDDDDGDDDDDMSGATMTDSFSKRQNTPRKPSFTTTKGRRPSYKSRAANRKLSESIKRISQSNSSDMIHEGLMTSSFTQQQQQQQERDTDEWETDSEDAVSEADILDDGDAQDDDEPENDYLIPVNFVPLPTTKKIKRKKAKAKEREGTKEKHPATVDKNCKANGERSNVIRKIQDKLKLLRLWKSTGQTLDAEAKAPELRPHKRDSSVFYEVVDIPNSFEEDESVHYDGNQEDSEPTSPRFVVSDDVHSSPRRQSKSSVLLSSSSMDYSNHSPSPSSQGLNISSASEKSDSTSPQRIMKTGGVATNQSPTTTPSAELTRRYQQRHSEKARKNASPEMSEASMLPPSQRSPMIYEAPPMSSITREIRLFCDDAEKDKSVNDLPEAQAADGAQSKTRSSSIPPPLPPRNLPTHQQRRSTIDYTIETTQRDSLLLTQVPPPAKSKPTLEVCRIGSEDLSDDAFDDKIINNDEFSVIKRSRFQSHFEREPLYQYTNNELFSSASVANTDSDIDEEYESDGAEYMDPVWRHPTQSIPVSPLLDVSAAESDKDSGLSASPTTASTVAMTTTTTLLGSAPNHRTLWCEMPEVIASGILKKIKSDERKIQEAIFEVITSEASYYKSLNVLINTFAMSEELTAGFGHHSVLSARDKHVLFSNIAAIRDVSERFLADVEARWRENVVIHDISDIVIKHCVSGFEPYVRYCSNKSFQDRKYEELMKDSEFTQAVRRLERTGSCQNLPMSSFFLLPMQRITRLPLLMDAVCRKMDVDTPRHKHCLRAIDVLNKVVKRCNDAARRMERTEQLCLIDKELDFKVKKIAVISASRYLVKRGELTRIVNDSSSILSFGRPRTSKQQNFLFLFNDLLLVTKKKSDGQYTVLDYCPRNSLHIKVIRDPGNCSWLPGGAPSSCKYLFMLALLDNHMGKHVEMILSANTLTDHTRWMEAVIPKVETTNEGEKIYEDWDCPQVQANREYVATQPDELSLENTDIVNVFRKMADGWYEGERIRDGERGWFPVSCVSEIENYHVRARNLRQRYRLLVASDDFTNHVNTTA